MSRSILPIAAALALSATAANAQSGANFNAGYGRTAGQENRAAATSTIRDANGNLLIVDGIIQTANGGSANYSSNSAGVGSNASPMSAGSTSGVGGTGGYGVASSVAIGNQLNVVTSGTYNMVIVNNTQTNNGQVSAGAIGNGGVSNGN